MQQSDHQLYYDSNSDDDNENDDDIFPDTVQVENAIEETNDYDDDNVHEEPINNEFLHPDGQRRGAAGMMFEHERVVYVQYCLYGELYYTPYKIYGDEHDKNEEATRMAYSNNMWSLWSLCNNTPSFQDNPMLSSELEYHQQIIKMNQRLAFQGVLGNCHDVGIIKSELQ